jgi:hypothetical protein
MDKLNEAEAHKGTVSKMLQTENLKRAWRQSPAAKNSIVAGPLLMLTRIKALDMPQDEKGRGSTRLMKANSLCSTERRQTVI